MATQASIGLIGRVGNVIHYKMGDKFYSRSAPRKFKQTKATKMRAREFGRSSSIASAIRQLLDKVIPDPSDRKMHGRLVADVFEWLQSFQDEGPDDAHARPIEGFKFTDADSVDEGWKVPLKITSPLPGVMQIDIPAFIPVKSFRAPKGTSVVVCKIAAGNVDLSTGRSSDESLTVLNFDYNNTPVPEQTISLQLSTPRNSLMVTGISLSYLANRRGKKMENKKKEYMPAGIVHALYI
jgi:hypothetical protein